MADQRLHLDYFFQSVIPYPYNSRFCRSHERISKRFLIIADENDIRTLSCSVVSSSQYVLSAMIFVEISTLSFRHYDDRIFSPALGLYALPVCSPLAVDVFVYWCGDDKFDRVDVRIVLTGRQPVSFLSCINLSTPEGISNVSMSLKMHVSGTFSEGLRMNLFGIRDKLRRRCPYGCFCNDANLKVSVKMS